ncbi:GIY-YIG nuclease family protein, partial [Flavobacterium sp.]
MKNYYFYILTNKFNTLLYCGITNNLKRRTFEHKNK